MYFILFGLKGNKAEVTRLEGRRGCRRNGFRVCRKVGGRDNFRWHGLGKAQVTGTVLVHRICLTCIHENGVFKER